jgi:hypothetical protein
MDQSIPGNVVDPDYGKRLFQRVPDTFLDEKLFGHEIYWAICGSREAPYRKGWQDFGMPFSVPYYDSDLGDAWLIVEELRRRGIRLSISSREDLDPSKNNCDEVIALKDEKYQVQRWNNDNQRYDPAVYGKTAPEAICKAAMTILALT